MDIYIADINQIDLGRAGELSGERAEKFVRLKQTDDKKRCLCSGLFINKFFAGAKITVNAYGKPYADNGRFFSISHSGDFVMFAVDDVELGCDIQQSRLIQRFEQMCSKILCRNELELLKNAEDRSAVFFDLWTKKESLLKCLGEGFCCRSLSSVDVSGDCCCINGTRYYFKLWHFNEYTACICSTQRKFPKKVAEQMFCSAEEI